MLPPRTHSLLANNPQLNGRIAILSPLGRNPGRPHGGITPVVVNLANQFVAAGMEVDLLVERSLESNRPTQLRPEIHVVELGAKHTYKLLLSVLGYLHEAHPRVLLTAGHRYNKIGAWAKRLSKTPTRICLSIHNNVTRGLRSQGRFRRWRRWASMKLLYGWADNIIAVSEGVARDFAKNTGIDGSRIAVIHNPIATSDIERRAREPIDHSWLEQKTTPVIMGMGRLARQKDFATLLRAFAKVRQRLDCRLIILGEGPDRPVLEALTVELGVEDAVSMPGFVSNPFAYLARVDLFALSSAWEGFGNVLVEALSVGVPVVATDCESGPREILDHGRFGSLVPVGDVDAMATAVIHQLGHPLDQATLRAAAARFSAADVAGRYLEVFSSHPAERPREPDPR